MANQIHIEDVILLIDTSRSMFRSDFRPTRLELLVKALHSLIKRKIEIDPNDRIGIVTYDVKAHKLHDFSQNPTSIIKSLGNIKIGGTTDIHEGLALSIQLLGNEIRKIGGKVGRILLFSDDRYSQMTDRMIKLANAAKGLGIFIDSMITGKPHQNMASSVLKKLSLITGGDHAYFNNENAFFNAAVALSSKKDLNDLSGYMEAQEREMNKAPLLSEIAVELRRPNITEIQDIIANPAKVKCNICYKSNCPLCHTPFYSCGRFCPSCGRAMHLHCASQWAKSSPDATEDVFRCPFCYFLLRIPPSFKAREDSCTIQPTEEDVELVKFVKVPAEQVPNIKGSCKHCNVIFLGEYNVYKCSNCGSHYHQPCVQEIFEKFTACKTCGKQIGNIQEILGS
ncbi:MAG: VWA domain-containing protein [Candidatus Hodarchaeota archaeon]